MTVPAPVVPTPKSTTYFAVLCNVNVWSLNANAIDAVNAGKCMKLSRPAQHTTFTGGSRFKPRRTPLLEVRTNMDKHRREAARPRLCDMNHTIARWLSDMVGIIRDWAGSDRGLYSTCSL